MFGATTQGVLWGGQKGYVFGAAEEGVLWAATNVVLAVQRPLHVHPKPAYNSGKEWDGHARRRFWFGWRFFNAPNKPRKLRVDKQIETIAS